MKKFLLSTTIFKLLVVLFTVTASAFLLFACDNGNSGGGSGAENFTNIVFIDQTFDYDGQEHELLVYGNVPSDANVVYENNKGTNAGTYTAKATVSKEGYNTLVLNATLKINKINYDMSSASWNYTSASAFKYNGSTYSVQVVGLPQGVTVNRYNDNSKINAGSYTASVVLNYDTVNHNAPVMPNLSWSIAKADYDMTNVKWSYTTPFYCNGQQKEVTLSGLPNGVYVISYINNKYTEAGTYTASAILSYDTVNYNTITVESCVWRILPNISGIASGIVNSLMKVPDPWSFLPDSFSLENKAYTGNTEIDFTSFVSVSSLPRVVMGKQMNVVYSALLYTEKALKVIRYIHGSANIITDFYQSYINANTEDYSSYEKETDNFTFKIVLENSDYFMFVSYKSVSLEFSYNEQSKKCYGRVQLTDSTVVKYEMAEDDLTIGISVLNIALMKLHFERDGELVNGYLYEYYGTESKNLKTSALIKVGNNYTSIIANKRETDDLIIEGYMEVYKNSTGNLVGAEVKESVKSVKYETSWFNIWNVIGINSVKAENEVNGDNLNTIYINGNASPIKTKLVGGLSLKALSRRFDIEMKDVYVIKYDASTESYDKVKMSIPMLFVQNSFIDSFSEDFYNANKNTGAVSTTAISMNSADKTFMFAEYSALIDEYLEMKEQVTYQSIKDYLGERNEYFN